MNSQERPLISFILFAYNQEKYVEEAIKGAFSQTYSPLEIILSDDCSLDGTYSIMDRLAKEYDGPHKVILNKNENNLGLVRHVDYGVSLTNSEIIIVGAGDDISLPNRAEIICEQFRKHPEALSISHCYNIIDDSGEIILSNPVFLNQGKYTISDYMKPGKKIPIYGATRAYKKEIFKSFPKLSRNCQAEDAALVFRSLMIGDIYHSSQTCLNYRAHSGSISKKFDFDSAKSIYKQNLKDLDFGISKQLIDPTNYNNIKNIMKRRLQAGLILKKMRGKSRSISYYFGNVFFSNLFSFNEKKNLFKGLVKYHTPSNILKFIKK